MKDLYISNILYILCILCLLYIIYLLYLYVKCPTILEELQKLKKLSYKEFLLFDKDKLKINKYNPIYSKYDKKINEKNFEWIKNIKEKCEKKISNFVDEIYYFCEENKIRFLSEKSIKLYTKDIQNIQNNINFVEERFCIIIFLDNELKSKLFNRLKIKDTYLKINNCSFMYAVELYNKEKLYIEYLDNIKNTLIIDSIEIINKKYKYYKYYGILDKNNFISYRFNEQNINDSTYIPVKNKNFMITLNNIKYKIYHLGKNFKKNTYTIYYRNKNFN